MATAEMIQLVTSMTTTVAVLMGLMIGFRLLKRFLVVREAEKEVRVKGGRQPDETIESVTVDPSGYIIINLPNAQKTLFMDLLKGGNEGSALRRKRGVSP